jgi:hypothetical protein
MKVNISPELLKYKLFQSIKDLSVATEGTDEFTIDNSILPVLRDLLKFNAENTKEELESFECILVMNKGTMVVLDLLPKFTIMNITNYSVNGLELTVNLGDIIGTNLNFIDYLFNEVLKELLMYVDITLIFSNIYEVIPTILPIYDTPPELINSGLTTYNYE